MMVVRGMRSRLEEEAEEEVVEEGRRRSLPVGSRSRRRHHHRPHIPSLERFQFLRSYCLPRRPCISRPGRGDRRTLFGIKREREGKEGKVA